jgi:hypothetical protein
MTLHKKQLTVEAMVMGSGMALADLVGMTVLRASPGGPSMTMHSKIPTDPMIGGRGEAAVISVSAEEARTALIC